MEMFRCFFLTLLCALFPALVIHAQDDQSGFISIDCGTTQDTIYTDEITGLRYVSDTGFVNSGGNNNISSDYNFKDGSVSKQLQTLRSFPDGSRNCYYIKTPAQGKTQKYLIRASFYHGKYDHFKNNLPIFDIHLGVDYWDTVNITDFRFIYNREIIHIPSSDYIHVCLINTGLGIPFISTLELRPLEQTMYEYSNNASESLVLFTRLDLGSTTGQTIRYKDDIFDRAWESKVYDDHKVISSTSTVSTASRFRPPSLVMSTAVTPLNSSNPLGFTWVANDTTDEFYFYFYFAELEILDNNKREISVYVNGIFFIDLVPKYLRATSLHNSEPVSNRLKHEVFFYKTNTSTLPPILNAVEIYRVRKLPHNQTDEIDFDAVMEIKSNYNVIRNWQGDPCGPVTYKWIGMDCSYDGVNPLRIISVNLSSSGLTGRISGSILDLKMLQTLDLSNNNLTGPVPHFLAELEFLKILNIKGNNFDGPVPQKLLEKSQDGLLSLSMDDVSNNVKKKNKVIIPVLASLSAVIILLISFTIIWIIRRRSKQAPKMKTIALSNNNDKELESNNKRFTYSEITKITNNFTKIIGQGGFGTVYHGFIDNHEVAVKILKSTSSQGYKEFQAEAKVLINVRHKNLTDMVGYCIEETKLAIIYEYMANGDLQNYLAEKNQQNALSWRERLQIAIDAAQGLEYLHHGCKQPIIHRDVKCTNILLDSKFQAKLADFGLSRAFPIEGGTHLSTVVAGTPGYLDPEYYMSNRLTEKSDIFSFGVVLLEIFTGRPVIQNYHPDSIHIIQWISLILKEGDVKEIIDPRVLERFDINSAWKAIEIAMSCVASDSTNRPTMNCVVMELKQCLEMEMTKADTNTIESIGRISLDHSMSTPLVR